MHERCRHDDEFAGDFKVEGRHQVKVFEEFLCDPGNRNVVDIQFIPLEKEQQEVEGSFEVCELYAVHAVIPNAWQCGRAP